MGVWYCQQQLCLDAQQQDVVEVRKGHHAAAAAGAAAAASSTKCLIAAGIGWQLAETSLYD
jgi:hypothetical protein